MAREAPCRHCGGYTSQRYWGIPYCSMTCLELRKLELRRREKEVELPA